jgi:hypothetical protein
MKIVSNHSTNHVFTNCWMETCDLRCQIYITNNYDMPLFTLFSHTERVKGTINYFFIPVAATVRVPYRTGIVVVQL